MSSYHMVSANLCVMAEWIDRHMGKEVHPGSGIRLMPEKDPQRMIYSRMIVDMMNLALASGVIEKAKSSVKGVTRFELVVNEDHPFFGDEK